MKRLFAAALAAFAPLVFGATLTPIQLISPAGSTAGQFLSSTGATSAPAWSTITLSGLPGTVTIANGGTGQTTQAAALAALLGSSTVPVANGGTGSASASGARTNLGLGTAATVNTGTSGATVPLLNGSNTWAAAQTFSIRPAFNGSTPWDSANLASPALTTGNLSQFASTTSTQLATLLSDETGSGSAVFSLTPTLTAPNIVGTISGGNAVAGSVGELLTNTTSSTPLTTGSSSNATSVSLTAGDWDVSGSVFFSPAASSTVSSVACGISTAAASLGALPNITFLSAGFTTGVSQYISTPIVRINVTSTTTVYLVAQSSFGVSTMTASGFIRARRVR